MAFEGICFYDGKSLINFKPKKEKWIRKIIEDKNRNLLFATRINGVYYYDLFAEKSDEKKFSIFSKPQELMNNSLTDIIKDKAENIWFASHYVKDIGDTLR